MATISSVGPGQTYTTWALFEAAFASGGWIGEQTGNLTAGCTFSGNSTSAANYIECRTAAGQSFRDHASVQTNAFTIDSTKGATVSQNIAYTDVFVLSDDYVTIKYLQIAQLSNGESVNHNNGSGNNCVLDSCIVENSGGIQAIRWRAGLMRNCLVVLRTSNAVIGIESPYGSPTIVNCTVVRPSSFSVGSTGIEAQSALIKNTSVFGFTTSMSGLNGSTDYNCSDVALSTGSNNKASKTYANQFVTTTDSGRDFKSKTGADLLNNGVVDTTNIPSSLDAVGTARSTTWDIGAWELVTSSNPTFSMAGSGAYLALMAAAMSSAGVGLASPKSASLLSSTGVGALTGISAALLVSAGIGAFNAIPGGQFTFGMSGVGAFNPQAAAKIISAGVGAFNPVPYTNPTFAFIGLGGAEWRSASKLTASGTGAFSPYEYAAAVIWTPQTPSVDVWTVQVASSDTWTPQ